MIFFFGVDSSMLFFGAQNYGIATTNADLWINSLKENETKIRMGDAVNILENCEDKKVLRVRTEDYEGYVNARGVGRCSQELMEKYCDSNSFVVAKRYFYYRGNFIRMGSRFPLVKEGTRTMECLLPQNVFGMFVVQKCHIGAEYLSCGYMECTPANILLLAESAEGLDYGWGDAGDGIDCSSYVGGIFRCFGIRLPRNVAQMLEMQYETRCVGNMSESEMITVLSEMGAGCLLFTRHHVMIYAGQQKEKPQFWHCSSRMGGKCLKSGFGPYLNEAVKIMKIK